MAGKAPSALLSVAQGDTGCLLTSLLQGISFSLDNICTTTVSFHLVIGQLGGEKAL